MIASTLNSLFLKFKMRQPLG